MSTSSPDREEVSQSEEVSAPELVERLIHDAERAQASDIHLQMQSGGASVLFRLDGVMTPATQMSVEVAERVFGRIKFLARLKTYQDSLPQDGRIDRVSVSAGTDIRVSTYPTVTGEKIVLRLFHSDEITPLEKLEFPTDVTESLEHFLKQTTGMLLLTGPAGSGKTTTIYACLRRLAEPGTRHIITVEDPAEQLVPGVMQTEVNEAQGLTFAKAARHLLRQDPQVLAIGEIRDEETANLAIRAALTGHLVISTLHAGSCRGVFERLLVMCRDSSAIATAVELVLNQRLLRRLCVTCAGKGCVKCLQTGYRGRTPILEFLRLNDSLRHQIAAGTLHSISACPTLVDRAAVLVQQGTTTEAEVERVLGAKA